jgi:hypothetical protein
MMKFTLKMSLKLTALLLLCASLTYSQGLFQINETIPVFAAKVSPFENPAETYE